MRDRSSNGGDGITVTVIRKSEQPIRRRLVLHVHYRGGSEFIDLPATGVLQLGRTDCDIVLRDASVSRQHVTLRLGETLDITDVGSRNGTRIANAPIAPHVAVPVRPYELIGIGDVVASIELVPDVINAERLLHPAEFETYLTDTAAVARRSGSELTIVFIAFDTAPRVDTLGSLIQQTLRTDCVAQYGEDAFRALLTDVPAPDCEARTTQLTRRLAEIDPKVRVRSQHLGDERAADGSGPIVSDPAMVAVYEQIRQFAAGKISVLINGETGAGKENLAEAVHRASPRASEPFLRLNCAALSDTLLESELFGHEKGAFTGATAAKPGLLETASGGTLFLDEVGELSLAAQAKLLRCLESGHVMRVGAVTPRAIDVRFVSATNRNLLDEASRGAFRSDLYYRIAAVTVVVPPLRARTSEIPLLARRFCVEAARELGRASVPELSAEVSDLLCRYAWPGNVRELRNVIHRAMLLCAGVRIESEHLPPRVTSGVAASSPEVVPEVLVATAPSAGGGEAEDSEHQRILDALARSGGNQTLAAQKLGVSRVTLSKRLQQYGIPRPRKRS